MRKVFVLLVLETFCGVIPVFAKPYTIQDLGVCDGEKSFANSINDYGQIAGHIEYPRSYDNPFSREAFYWNDGSFTKLGNLGGSFSQAYQINNAGHIVGSSKVWDEQTDSYHTTGFYWTSSTGMQRIGFDDCWYSSAYGINNSDKIVAYGRRNDDYYGIAHVGFTGDVTNGFNELNSYHENGGGTWSYGISDNGYIVGAASSQPIVPFTAFIYKNGNMTDLGTLGGRSSVLFSVNSSGQAVGHSEMNIPQSYNDDIIRHALLWQDGQKIDLETLGGKNSGAYSINENGDIVGSAETLDGEWHAFVMFDDDDVMIDLNSFLTDDLSWDYLAAARDINNNGQIVGYGYIDGHEHAFLMTPVPEPSSIFLFGTAFLTGRRYRRC